MTESPTLAPLVDEAIFILREVAAQCGRATILFSGGKDSVVLADLARRAWAPARCPLPLLHIDTGHNFPETIAFRDRVVADDGWKLEVASVAEAIGRGIVSDEAGAGASRNALQGPVLVDAIRRLGIDCAIGGARRDEEKSRAKERLLSIRDSSGRWDPRRQRPEPFRLLNAKLTAGATLRAFPLSNWTERDIWSYIGHHRVALPPLYFAHEREVVERGGLLLPVGPWTPPLDGERPQTRRVRFRTVGDMTCSGAVDSSATTVSDILAENADGRLSERSARADDRRGASALERRKTGGYF